MRKVLSLILWIAVASLLPQSVSAQQEGLSPESSRQVITPMRANAMLSDVVGLPAGFNNVMPGSDVVNSFVLPYPIRNPFMPLATRPNALREATPLTVPSTPLIGALISSKSKDKYIGVYSIATDGTDTHTQLQDEIWVAGGAVLIDDKYYTTDYDIFGGMVIVNHIVYDAKTWEPLYSANGSVENVAIDMAYDPTTGNVYGCFWNSKGDGLEFGVLDVNSWTRSTICTLSEKWLGVGISGDGTLYAITGDGSLYIVDKSTGEMALVGNTGLITRFHTSAALDRQTGRFYYVPVTDSASNLYEINLKTAEATLVTDFADRSVYFGLCVDTRTPDIESGAPASVTDMKADFDGASHSGTLTFTAPSTICDGTPATGQLTYEVQMNGDIVATGQTVYGQEVDVPISVTSSGSYVFIVTVKNDIGVSPRQELVRWIGYGQPKEVKNVILTWADDQMNLTWDAVTESINDAYFDPAAITYTVTRWPDGVVVADGISATSFSEPMVKSDKFIFYHYTVAAVMGDSRSALSESNSIMFGEKYPPYSNNFDDDNSLDEYTFFNLNYDGTNWNLIDGMACMESNNTLEMNAWLITPGVWLEPGYFYDFSFEAICSDDYSSEHVEAFLGTSTTHISMTTRLVNKTEILSYKKILHANFYVETPGIYYFGIHGCSYKGSSLLCIDNLSVTQGASTAYPTAVTDLEVVADDMGSLTASVSFTAPDKTFAGEQLASISTIELSRDGRIIHTFESPAPGERLSYTDNVDTDGTHVYSVVAANEFGVGASAETSIYVGVRLPSSPMLASVVETDNDGEVHMEWEAPSTDIEGYPLNPELVTYTIVDNDNNVIVENLSDCSYTYQAVADGEAQKFVRYGIFAATRMGLNDKDYAFTEIIPVGRAYNMPIAESFTGGNISNEYIWGAGVLNGRMANVGTFVDNDEIKSQDGDNGYCGTSATVIGQAGQVLSGKVHVAEEKNPALTFYYYAYNGGLNTIDVQVDCGDGFETVKTFVAGATVAGWQKTLIPLDEYRGQDIRFRFYTKAVSHRKTMFDNIRVCSLPEDNLAATAISVPRKMPAARKNTIAVKVDNYGTCKSGDYSVELYRNGALVQTVTGYAIEAMAADTVYFKETPGVVYGDTLRYHAVVVYTADSDPCDNTTNEAVAVVVMPEYPPVADLAYRQDGTNVRLAWGEPGLCGITSGPVTDSFEDYESFAVDEAGKWMFIDGDGSLTYKLTLFNYPNAQLPMAYIVFERSVLLKVSAHKGNKSMVSCASVSETNDDWLISPELAGCAQTVSFFARGMSSGATFELYYSTTGINKDDFVRIGDEHQAESDWTEYQFDVPAEATYFAIRCTSTGGHGFLIDDVTYIPATSSVSGLGLVGYNVYRDGVRLNTVPMTELGYTDVAAGSQPHSYFVTVVYDKGESRPSNVITTGVGDDIYAVIDDDFDLSVAERAIIITNAEGNRIYVCAPDGRTVYNGDGKAFMHLSVIPGIYIVRAGTHVMKVSVK